MGLLENVISGAIGYGISEVSKSHPVKDLVDKKFGNKNKSIRDVVTEYAREHGIYANDDNFAEELHKLARLYESYNYDRNR